MQGTDAVRQVHLNGLHSVVQRQGGLRQLLPDNELILVGSEYVPLPACMPVVQLTRPN